MSEHWSAAGRWSYCRSERYRVIDSNAPISPRQCGMISLLAAWRKLAAFPWSPCSPSQAYFWNVGMLGTQHLSTSQQLAKNYEGTMWAWRLSFLLLVWLIFFNRWICIGFCRVLCEVWLSAALYGARGGRTGDGGRYWYVAIQSREGDTAFSRLCLCKMHSFRVCRGAAARYITRHHTGYHEIQ